MKTILLIFIPVLLFSQIYLHNVPCTDNAADTIVANNGAYPNWIASVNTNTIYDATLGGNFLLDVDGDYVFSAENLTRQYYKIQWEMYLKNDPAIHPNAIFIWGDTDLGADNHEIRLQRNNAVDEFTVVFYVGGASFYRETTDAEYNEDTFYTFIATIDLRNDTPIFSLNLDGTELSWGSWTGTPTDLQPYDQGAFRLTFGESGINELEGRIKNILVWIPGEGYQNRFPIWPDWTFFPE